jgi:opacity protein-like surface antigen
LELFFHFRNVACSTILKGKGIKMKKIILIAAIGLLYYSSEAQLIRGYGIKAGTVGAGQDWTYAGFLSGSMDTKTRWGIDAGGYVEWLDIPFVSFLTECHYIQKGFKISIPVTTLAFPEGTGEYQERFPQMNYVSIPIMAKVRMSMPLFTPYIIGGIHYDILLSTSGDGFDEVIKNTKNYDTGVTIGAGVESNVLPKITVGLEFRYSPSVMDIYSTDNLKVRNHSVEVLGYVGF